MNEVTKSKKVGPVVIEINSLDKLRQDDKVRLRNEISISIVDKDGLKKTMLPFCGSELLLSPDAIVRGSLFGLGTHETIKRKIDGKWSRIRKRLHYSQALPKECGEFGSVRISYIGEALDQGDLDVWLRLIDLAKDNLTKTIKISFNQLLIDIGRSCGGASYDLLNSSLERLSTGHIKLESGDLKVIDGVALIKKYKLNEQTRQAEILLNEDTARLFSTDRNLGWTRIQKIHRESLIGQELSLWLHAFYSSHAKPIPLSLTNLHALSGSTSLPKEFKRMLMGYKNPAGNVVRPGALNELVKIGFLLSWKIEDNILSVVRNRRSIQPSQLKYVDQCELF